jgi:MFS transporter, YNFM family, putative membrane transport protein
MVTCVAEPETRHRRGSSAFRRITIALFCAGLATFGTLYALQPLLPSLTSAFHLSPAAASLSVSVATCALAVGVLPLTALSETVGRTPVMTVSLFTSAGLALLVAVSPNFTVLLVLRALQGLALAGIQAVAMSYLVEELHRDCLGFAMGLYIAGTGFGGMTGRLVAALVDDAAGWRWALAAVAAVALACTIAFLCTIVPSAGFQPRPPRVPELAASIGRAFTDTKLMGLFAVGFLLMGCFVTVYNYLGFRLLGPGFGLSGTVVGLISVVYLAGTFSSALAGRLADRFGRPQVLWIMAIVTLAGVLLLAMGSVSAVIIGLVITTGGFFAAHSVASGWVSARSATLGLQGSAVYAFCYYLGSSVGGTVGGLVFSAARWSGVTAYIVALLLTVLIIAILLRTRPQARMFRPALPMQASTTALRRPGIRLWRSRRRTRPRADGPLALAGEQEGLAMPPNTFARAVRPQEVGRKGRALGIGQTVRSRTY